jgi:hypothetical protein
MSITSQSPLAVPVILAALAVAAPGQAAANPTVGTDRTCYSPGEPVIESGSGFTPNAQVNETVSLLAGGRPIGTGSVNPPITTDAQGMFTRSFEAPDLMRPDDRAETVIGSFADQGSPQSPLVVGPAWTLSAWEVRISAWAGHRANPRRSMVIDTTGWTTLGPNLYSHYYRGSKLIKDAKVGRLTGACGDLRKRVRQFPFHGVRAGMWTVYFSDTPTLDKVDDAWIRIRVRVRVAA